VTSVRTTLPVESQTVTFGWKGNAWVIAHRDAGVDWVDVAQRGGAGERVDGFLQRVDGGVHVVVRGGVDVTGR
jgi:hypothetical protein